MTASRRSILPVRERDVQAACLTELRVLGLDPERQNTGVGQYSNPDGTTRVVRYGTPGQLDLKCVLPDGRACEIEAKIPGKRPTDLQRDRMQKLNASNGVAFWVDDPEQIKRLMPLILAGCWVEMDERCNYAVTDEGREMQ